MQGMVIDMDDEQLRTLVDVQGFLDGMRQSFPPVAVTSK